MHCTILAVSPKLALATTASSCAIGCTRNRWLGWQEPGYTYATIYAQQTSQSTAPSLPEPPGCSTGSSPASPPSRLWVSLPPLADAFPPGSADAFAGSASIASPASASGLALAAALSSASGCTFGAASLLARGTAPDVLGVCWRSSERSAASRSAENSFVAPKRRLSSSRRASAADRR